MLQTERQGGGTATQLPAEQYQSGSTPDLGFGEVLNIGYLMSMGPTEILGLQMKDILRLRHGDERRDQGFAG